MDPDHRALARRTFAAGDYFGAHEHWEALWRGEPDPARRAGWQGLILVAVAFLKLERGRPVVAARLLRRAADRLAAAPERVDGVDLVAVRGFATRTAQTLERGEPAPPPPDLG